MLRVIDRFFRGGIYQTDSPAADRVDADYNTLDRQI